MDEKTEIMQNNSMVSVIMGIYNCAATLPKAIESIINQTYPNWELILCDDSSTDNTYQVAKKYQQIYPNKIILIQNEVNYGLAYSLNRCLKFTKGAYIARMDGDDISAPMRLEKQVNYLQTHPDVQLVGSAIQWFDDENKPTYILYKPEHPDKSILRDKSPFLHPTIMTYKSVYDHLGGYTVSERTRRCEDYELWFRFFAHGFRGDNIQEPLYLYREDLNAINKRTFKSRWNAFLVAADGFRLLGFPKWWIVMRCILTIGKSIMPYRLQFIYKKLKKRLDC